VELMCSDGTIKSVSCAERKECSEAYCSLSTSGAVLFKQSHPLCAVARTETLQLLSAEDGTLSHTQCSRLQFILWDGPHTGPRTGPRTGPAELVWSQDMYSRLIYLLGGSR